MTDLFNNDTPDTATELHVLAFSGSTYNGPTSSNFAEFGSVGWNVTPSFTSDVRDYYTFTPYKLESIRISFDADSVGNFVSILGAIPISGVSKVEGAVVGTWYGGVHTEHHQISDNPGPYEPDFRPTPDRAYVENGAEDVLSFVKGGGINRETGLDTDWSEATWSDNEFPSAEAVWYLTGEPVVFRFFGLEGRGTTAEIDAKNNVPEEASYDFKIFPKSGLPDVALTFEETVAVNTIAAMGIATAYQVLLGGVPNQAGFSSLINTAISSNFGAGVGPVFNQENIFINLINNLVQGNPAARASFDSMAAGSTLEAKVTSIYQSIVPASKQTADGLAFLTSNANLQFYKNVAAERGVAGIDGAAIVSLASLLNITVNSDIGVGNSVNDLIKAIAEESDSIPPGGSVFIPIETADGTAFDGDDAVAMARLAAPIELTEAYASSSELSELAFASSVSIMGLTDGYDGGWAG